MFFTHLTLIVNKIRLDSRGFLFHDRSGGLSLWHKKKTVDLAEQG